MEEAEDLDESELNSEMEGLIVQANAFDMKWGYTKRVILLFKIFLIIQFERLQMEIKFLLVLLLFFISKFSTSGLLYKNVVLEH
jgi:hypothetical protein